MNSAEDKKMISFEISDDLRERLRVQAFKESTTISALMRELLNEALLNRNKFKE